jgi:hypothetical protein
VNRQDEDTAAGNVTPQHPQPPRNLREIAKLKFHRKFVDLILVAAVGLEPTTYGL